ncbi:hypothetical protein MMC07_005985 [Pseudocyphellaria aurata]|nr:hypothetical protein [Pseudocyphellaria aurata]
MSGFEIVGLVLASYPLLITAVAVYNETRSDRGARRLVRSLKTEEAIFNNFLHRLLQPPIISEAELALLIDPASPDLELWKDTKLQNRLEARLGHENASIVVDILWEIHKILGSLRNELKSKEHGMDVLRRFRASLRNVRHCLPNSSVQVHLNSLKSYSSDLERLLADRPFISIVSCQKSTAPFKRYLRRDYSCAIGIYDALYDGYRCDCDAPHLAQFGLPRISEDFGAESDDAISDEQFELVFPVDNLHSFSTSTSTLVPEPTLNDTATSRTRRVSICECNHGCSDEERNTIQDLCNLLKTLDADKEDTITRLGTLGLREKQYELRMPVCTPSIASYDHMVCLDHHLTDYQFTLERKERMDLALRLSYAILQFYSTPWIEACWTWRDFFIDKQNDSQLFVTRKFYSRSRNSMPEEGSSPTSNVLAIVGEPILIKLGFALIELAIGRRLAELRPDDQPKDMDPDTLDFLTAKKLVASGRIMRVESFAYEGVVKACLYHQFICRSQLTSIDSSGSNFQADVEQSIIEPLHNIWNASWGKLEQV